MSYQVQRALERQENILQEELDNGFITVQEYNEAMDDLHREYREMARESARDAYENELDRW